METENGDSKSKMEDYSGIQQIGRGAFGAAFLVLHKTENKKYVLKKIRLPKQIDKFKNKECQEMSLIEKLRHPYIVEYKDAWVEKGNCICIVTEYCEVGNISEILRKARGTYFSEEKLCKWLTQLLLAIDYLHSNRLLHGNLKLSNIFVTKENNIRLGDFGLAKILNEEGLAPSFATSSYTCPELLADSPYGYKSDIWSLGCCMFEIAAHQQAFRAPDMAGLINKINRSLISPLPIVYSSTLKQIIKSMLRKSPEHRPTAAELLRHSHLQPFLLRCDNPSTVFLPVKSPSPNNAKEKEKSRKPSPSSNGGAKNYKEREVEVKQRELLPLFEESTNMEYPSLLDGDAVIEDELETKRVDPTSFSRNTSEDSESLCTSETTACNGDNQDDNDSSATKESIYVTNGLILPTEDQEKYSVKHTELDKNEREREETIDSDTLCSPHITEETNLKAEDTTLETLEKCMKTTMPDTVCDDNVASRCDENTFSTKDKGTSEIDPKQDESTGECSGVSSDGMQTEEDENSPVKGTVKIKEDISTDPIQAVRDEIRLIMNNQEPSDSQLLDTRAAIGSDESKDDGGIPGELKADALESLLELCARLLKQDKFDELSGVLKPFGDDAVSSRETAIWLTKSLMNAQNLAKKS